MGGLSARAGAPALLLVFSVLPLRAQQVTWTAAAGVASGDYIFSARTTTWSLSSGVSLDAGRLNLALSVPLVIQNSTAVTLLAGVPVPTGGPDNAAVRRREQGATIPMGPGGGGQRRGNGDVASRALRAVTADPIADSVWVAATGPYEAHLADPVLGAGLTIVDGTGVLRNVGVHAYAKAPLASLQSGVGTGRWDWAGGVSVTLGAGATLLFGDAAWWWLGDLRALPLRDGVRWSAGAGRALGRSWSLLASLSGANALVPGVASPLDAGLAVMRRIGPTGSVSLAGGAGLSEASPDLSIMVGWSSRLVGGARD